MKGDSLRTIAGWRIHHLSREREMINNQHNQDCHRLQKHIENNSCSNIREENPTKLNTALQGVVRECGVHACKPLMKNSTETHVLQVRKATQCNNGRGTMNTRDVANQGRCTLATPPTTPHCVQTHLSHRPTRKQKNRLHKHKE